MKVNRLLSSEVMNLAYYRHKIKKTMTRMAVSLFIFLITDLTHGVRQETKGPRSRNSFTELSCTKSLLERFLSWTTGMLLAVLS